MKAKLTPKQEKFCHAYLETGNASEAYRTAYSTDRMKPATIKRKAKELLDHERVSATIRQLKEELKEVSDIRKRRILYELNAILEAKVTDYIEWDNGTFKMKDLSKLPEEMVRAVETIKHTRYGVEIKLKNKLTAIERICKMLGYDAPDKLDLTADGKPVSGVIILPSNGREVTVSDKPE